MDHHIKEFYRRFSDDAPRGSFYKVIALHEAPDMSWEAIHKLIPSIPKGWYELAHLPITDRIDFTRDYWQTKMPFHLHCTEFLNKFFTLVEDIGIFIVQKKIDEPIHAEMVYSLKEGKGFFRGNIPATDLDLADMQRHFLDNMFPTDYGAFLQIHNGFCKSTDTGLTSSYDMPRKYAEFQEMVDGDSVSTNHGKDVTNPKTLIPFYESFGMPFYQCFWSDWYPENEMGNVYFSGLTKTISDVKCKDPESESMAFSTFTRWLMFYLETVE